MLHTSSHCFALLTGLQSKLIYEPNRTIFPLDLYSTCAAHTYIHCTVYYGNLYAIFLAKDSIFVYILYHILVLFTKNVLQQTQSVLTGCVCLSLQGERVATKCLCHTAPSSKGGQDCHICCALHPGPQLEPSLPHSHTQPLSGHSCNHHYFEFIIYVLYNTVYIQEIKRVYSAFALSCA